MKIVATFHGPSSVSHSLGCTLTTDEDIEFLVVAKTTILEVFAVIPEAIKLQCTFEIWGRITSISAVPTKDTAQHNLLVTTDHPDPKLLLLEYSEDSASSDRGGKLECLKSISLNERGARPTEFFCGSIIDQRGRLAAISLYVGKLKIVELRDNQIYDSDVSVKELNIISMCFLLTSNSRSTSLAFLHRDHTQKTILTAHELSDSDLSSSPSPLLPDVTIADDHACLLIPVPPHSRSAWNTNGGVLVLGGARITFYAIDRKQKKKTYEQTHSTDSARSPRAEIDWPYTDVSAWTQADSEGSRFLLSDSFGRLALLAFHHQFQQLDLVRLGEVSPPTTITPLPSQYVFIGSHFGDSQLVRIVPDLSVNGTYVEVADSFKNIAPIMDAVTADLDGSGQAAIVTCSGGKSTGSLRVVRNGADVQIDAIIESIPNVHKVSPLRSRYDDRDHSFLLVSTATSSHLLQLPGTAAEIGSIVRETNFDGLRVDSRTLAAGNVLTFVKTLTGKSSYESGHFAVQVTPNTVSLLNMNVRYVESEWSPSGGKEIVLADLNPSQICLALAGGEILLMNVMKNGITEISRKVFSDSMDDPPEVSALSIAPLEPDATFSRHLVVAFWSSCAVKVYSLPEFSLVGDMIIMPHLPRSVSLYDFGTSGSEPRPYLVIGLANGSVSVLPLTKGTFGEKRDFSLGDGPVFLNPCIVKGRRTILTSGTRSALLSWSKDSLISSPVLLKDVSAASSIDAAFARKSMVFASPVGIAIGRIIEVDKLHVRAVDLGLDNPVKLAYIAPAKLFGVGCLREDPSRPPHACTFSSTFKIFDAVDFAPIFQYAFEQFEEITALSSAALSIEGKSKMCFVAGSLFYEDTEREPSRGRILVFSVDSRFPGSSDAAHPFLPGIQCKAETDGCVYALCGVTGKLVAAINTSVALYGLETSPSDYHTVELVKLAEWNHNYLVTSVVVQDDLIVTGDAVSSVAVLRLVDGKFVTKARDYGPLWPLCIEMFDPSSIIGADSDNNIFSFKIQQQGDKFLLERDGSYHTGDVVNKFLPASLAAQSTEHPLKAKQLFFTSSGRIGVIIQAGEQIAYQLSQLQRNIAGHMRGLANMDHTSWRAPMNPLGRSDAQAVAFGFLDGDLIEHFLDYSEPSQVITQIMAGKDDAEKLDVTYERICSVLRSLRGTH